MARVKYYDSTTQTWKYADMALQTGIHVGTTAPTNEAMLWVDTASNQIDSFPLTDVQDSEGNSLIVNQIAVIPTTPSGTNAGDILVWNGSAWEAKPKWRMIYQPCEYIESSGTQWIGTGAVAKVNTRIVEKVKYVATNIEAIEGSSVSGSSVSYGIISTYDYFRSRIDDAQGTVTWDSTGVAIDNTTVHTWDIQSGSQKFDGTEYATKPIIPGEYQLCLFGRRGYNTTTPCKVRIYEAQYYEGDTLIRDYIPVYNLFTGEIGLFDKANNIFYGNNGSGTFTKGADVN